MANKWVYMFSEGNNFFASFRLFFMHISQFEILFHIMELLPFKFLCKICIQIFDLDTLLLHPALAPVKIGVLPLSKKLNEGASAGWK